MVRKSSEMEHLFRENIRGGVGKAETDVIFKSDEMLGKSTLCNRMTLKPGSTIGEHDHVSDAEIYYVIEGEVYGVDNGTPIKMEKGDAMFTGNGDRHALENRSDRDAVILAIVLA